jgi:hypothetical protein
MPLSKEEHSVKNPLLVPVSPEDLVLLQWFADWTPKVHRADWKLRRAWPPGFREVADLSAFSPMDHARQQERLAAPPERLARSRVRDVLLPYRLVEGTPTCARLTERGRAALKLAGRNVPGRFSSHAPDVFDDVLLVSHHENDHADGWREMLTEYQDDDYRGRHTLTAATGTLSTVSSTGTFLNGSIREHHRLLRLSLQNAAHHTLVEVYLSFESLAELLTSSGSVPVTLQSYLGADGMRRSEPAPPLVSAQRRMLERLDQAEEGQAALLTSILTRVQDGNIPIKLKQQLVRDLENALQCGRANEAYVVQQAIEEVSVAVESLSILADDRQELLSSTDREAGSLPPVLRTVLLGEGS